MTYVKGDVIDNYSNCVNCADYFKIRLHYKLPKRCTLLVSVLMVHRPHFVNPIRIVPKRDPIRVILYSTSQPAFLPSALTWGPV